MQIQYHNHFSRHLGRDMEFKVYGHGGKPVLFIPCQGGRFYDFENFHMLEHWSAWLDEGRCQVFSIDTVDNEAWACVHAGQRQRIVRHEQWYNYVVEELVPQLCALSGRSDILLFGCSMGAMHAANLFFRRPDIFDSFFSISGIYDSLEFFGDYMDELVYNNCPVTYLANMPQDHPYMQLYAQRKMLIVVGQGRWEEPLLASTRRLDTVLCEKGIPAKVEYWGHDVDHDWPWWFKMVAHYVPWLLQQE